MVPSAREKRLRFGAGLSMAGLGVLSIVMILASVRDRRADVALVIIGCVQAFMVLGLGTYLACGKGGTAELVLSRGRWRKLSLLVTALLGVAAFVWQLIDDPLHLMGATIWPNLVALGIFLQFTVGGHRFQNEEKWITALSPQEAVQSLAREFGQPGMHAKVTGSDVWVEISPGWHSSEWRHRDAAKHMKTRPCIHFAVDATDDGTRVTAFSRDRMLLGMYDVLKFADEMSESGVVLGRQATS